MALIKKYGVLLALIFTLAATVWVSQQKETDELVVARDENSVALSKADVEAAKQISPPVPTLVDYLLQRSPDHDVPKNIFTPLATENNPEMNIKPAIALPENPFVYAGKVVEDGALVVFLIDGEKSHAVKSGDVIEDTWTVKAITPPTMTLKYIPLKMEVQMQIGANS
ncbi:hypothetical protein [Methylotenera sp.]|uniref:hypothetical protein n=1 Tax=Methylotenera sp. TaxID=2051956 RepID=UPI002487987D|nr:hypothetical protein [Methylotenera sp.]MDI1298713.1 hypothetical protein [Methylotenera sp.]